MKDSRSIWLQQTFVLIKRTVEYSQHIINFSYHLCSEYLLTVNK